MSFDFIILSVYLLDDTMSIPNSEGLITQHHEYLEETFFNPPPKAKPGKTILLVNCLWNYFVHLSFH